MPKDLLISGIISELLPVTTSSLDESSLSKEFLSLVKRDFGIEEAELLNVSSGKGNNQIEEYMVNTRKSYIDNQLSEYSQFSDLIEYKNKGYKSCALIPVTGNGRVISVLRLLSQSENKFEKEMVDALEIASTFFAFSFLYKSEINKNTRLAKYFDAAFDSLVPQMLVSSSNSIIKANKSARKLFGLTNQRMQTSKELLGFEFGEMLAQKEGRFDVYLNLSDTHNIYRFASRPISDNLLHLSGENVTGKLIMDSILGALQGSKDLYIVFTRKDFTIISASPNFEKLLKYSDIMLPGKRFTDFIKENEAQDLTNQSKAMSGPMTMQLNIMTGDYTLPTRTIITEMPFGHIITIIATEAESYIKEAKENISNFIESTSDIAMKIDNFGYIKECNLPIEGILGYSKDEILGREIRQLYKDPNVFDRDIAYVKNGGKVDNSYVDMVKKDSDIVSGMQSVRMLRGSKDEEGYLLIIKELETKRKLSYLDSLLKETQGEIKKQKSVSTQKSEFIYDITHELKTPLTNIKGFSALLSDGQAGELNKSQKDYVDTILAESNRLMLVIQQVLDAAKLEADKVKLDFKELDLKELYNKPAIKSLEEAAHQKGLEFKWNTDFDVPSIMADPNRLLQVFVNLVGNAIKFTEKGSITVNIFRKTKQYIECDIIDTGIGIAEEDKKKLFKKFYQAPKKELARQDGAGTGLGLSITRDIITLHGGKINFESTYGKGSKFWFQLKINRKAKPKP